MAPKGERNGMWKGNDATKSSLYERARRYVPMPDGQLCEAEGCPKPALDRHHKDGDIAHNVRGNIEFLCRRHHMERDGRMAALKARVSQTPRSKGRWAGSK